jgi:NAD-dependent dihydropyrimidine dehydrogenase PreA subunit
MEVIIMAYKITDECVSCGACADQCPQEAIAQGADHYEIDPDKCVDCGACADTCPMSAIEEA